MESSLELLGVPRDIVEFERSTGSLKKLLAIAEGAYKLLAPKYHPDVNHQPGAKEIFFRLNDAIEDLRDPDGLELAVERLVGEADKHANRRRIEQSIERKREKQSLRAMFDLLVNVGQFSVLDVTGPTSFLLQFGASRTILDVSANDQATLYLTSQDLEVLPEQTERAEFIGGHWREMYLTNEVKHWLNHVPTKSSPVTVVGFVPAQALRYQTEETIQVIHQERVELGEGVTEPRMVPVWTEPSEAWYVRFIKPKPTQSSEVVVRNHRGLLSIVGSIQAQAFFYEKQ